MDETVSVQMSECQYACVSVTSLRSQVRNSWNLDATSVCRVETYHPRVCVCVWRVCITACTHQRDLSNPLTPADPYKCTTPAGLSGVKVISALDSWYSYQLECVWFLLGMGACSGQLQDFQSEGSCCKKLTTMDNILCYNSPRDQRFSCLQWGIIRVLLTLVCTNILMLWSQRYCFFFLLSKKKIRVGLSEVLCPVYMYFLLGEIKIFILGRNKGEEQEMCRNNMQI